MEAPKGLIQMPKCAKGLMFGGSVSPKPPYASKAGRTEHTRPDWTRPATPDPSNDAQVGLPRHGLSLTTADGEDSNDAENKARTIITVCNHSVG